MRILLLADVHANWEALLALQHAEPRPDSVLFVGDAVGYGPDPANCTRWLLANTAAAVRGNHDQAVLLSSERREARGDSSGFPPELEDAARETIVYASTTLAPEDIEGIQTWPLIANLTLGGARFCLLHGTPADPLNGWLNAATCPKATLRQLFESIPADVIVLGHTHLPALRRFNGKLIVNPGSLGQPRYGVPDATYGVWDDGHVQIKHLHYDHVTVSRRLSLTPLSPESFDVLTDVLETGLL
jgi:putative phosphoesterase